MQNCFKLIKIALMVLIGVAILNDLGTYLYVVMVANDTSDFSSVMFEVLAFLLAGYFVYRNNFIADFITCALALESLNTIYQATPDLFSLAWLKTGPQILFSNILMAALLIISIVHFILLITRKITSKN